MKRLMWIAMIAACGSSTTGGDDDTQIDGGQSTVLVEGVPADQFYGQFAYAKTQTGIEGAAAFATNSAGNDAYLAEAFLMPNGALTLFYAEGEGDVDSTGWSISTQPANHKKRTGTWSVSGANLDLGGFMTCSGLTYNDKPKLRCQLAQPIISAAAQGQGGMFDKMFSASTPDDSAFANYGP